MIFQAWDNPSPFVFVVITADRDLSYALAMLRMKSYRIVLISPAGSHPDLTSQASEQLDWSRTILGINGGSNEDGLFQKEPSDRMPSSIHAPGRSSNYSRAERGTFVLEPADFPPRTLRDSPAIVDKPSLFSSSYDRGFNVLSDPLGLGDGPLFPRSHSVNQNPLGPQSEFFPEFRPTLTKDKVSGLEDGVEFHPLPPASSSQSRLSSSASVFKPRSYSSGSRQSKSSFEQISKPIELSTSEPVEQQPRKPLNNNLGRLSNGRRSVVTPPSVSQKRAKSPTLSPPPLPPPPVVIPSVTSTHPSKAPKSQKVPPKLPPPSGTSKPSKAAKSQTAAPRLPPAPGSSSSIHVSMLPAAWMPLIKTLREHNGVLPRNTIAVKLLNSYPDAFKTAGKTTITSYLNAAIGAGIVSKFSAPGKREIYLTPRYSISLPSIWMPLIQTLRRHNGVLPRSTIAVTLLNYYPNAFNIAGKKNIARYLKAARAAGIVSTHSAYGTAEIHLSSPYWV